MNLHTYYILSIKNVRLPLEKAENIRCIIDYWINVMMKPVRR